jgi:hypothetical protein
MKKEIEKGLVLPLALIVIGVASILMLAKFIGVGEQVDNYLPADTILSPRASSVITLDNRRIHTWRDSVVVDSLGKKNDSL